MKMKELFLGYREFESKKEIISYVENSLDFNSQLENLLSAEALLIFKTSNQQTWLVSTSERLYCILDDIRKSKPNINWSIPKNELVSKNRVIIELKRLDKTSTTGVVDIGSKHRNWLYSKVLFEDISIENSIIDLINNTIIEPQGIDEIKVKELLRINWDSLEKEIDEAIERAAGRTDEKLSSKISSLTKLSEKEVEELFPSPYDVRNFSSLMKIVKSAEDRNKKVTMIKQNIEELGDIVITLLEKFSYPSKSNK